jgi:hypothetical protein
MKGIYSLIVALVFTVGLAFQAQGAPPDKPIVKYQTEYNMGIQKAQHVAFERVVPMPQCAADPDTIMKSSAVPVSTLIVSPAYCRVDTVILTSQSMRRPPDCLSRRTVKFQLDPGFTYLPKYRPRQCFSNCRSFVPVT